MNKITVITVLLSSLLLLSSCAEKKETFIERPTEKETDIIIESENDELLALYNKHKETASLAFKTFSDNSKEEFEYIENDGKIIINKYIGKSNIVKIPSVIDGKNVVEIADEAFFGAVVDGVYVPDSVQNIGFNVFGDCSLETLRIPFIGDGKENKNAGYIFGAEKYDENGLNVPSSLKMIIIGEGVDEIADNAFYNFKSLEAVVLPESLEKIGNFAFYDSRSLVYVNFPSELKSIGEYAFLNCQSLYITELNDGVENIGLGAFMDCSSLKYMTLPYVGMSRSENNYLGYIFGGESKDWNESYVPKSLSYIKLSSVCENIGVSAFSHCVSLISVDIGDNVKNIGVGAFEYCTSLKDVNIGLGVEYIGEEAFSSCAELENIHFSENSSLKEIKMQAFMNCKAIRDINLPKSIEYIGRSAFYNCTSLEKITAVGNITVDDNAFLNCNKVSDVKGLEKSGISEKGNQTLISAIK